MLTMKFTHTNLPRPKKVWILVRITALSVIGISYLNRCSDSRCQEKDLGQLSLFMIKLYLHVQVKKGLLAEFP
jgi:hypothetical protein